MASTRLKGTKLSLEIDGQEYKGDLQSYKITSEEKDSDAMTFGDMEEGDMAAFLMELGFVQSTEPQSLFMQFWNNTGKTVRFKLAPHGNEIPTISQPHLEGELTIPLPPEFGGEAGTATFTSSATCNLTGKPTLVTTGSGDPEAE